MRKKKKPSELALDLEGIRKLKRLTKRVWKGLEQMEKHLLKMEGKKDRQGKASEREIKILNEEFYGEGMEIPREEL